MTQNELELARLKNKCNNAIMMLKDSTQAYHMLANVVNSDKHRALHWTECKEPTCVQAKESYSKLGFDIDI